MAEIVVSAAIKVLSEKLISGDLMKLARSEGIDSKLIKWKKILVRIHAVLADAGKKQNTVKAVEQWLNELQDTAYDIEDVLDDLATDAWLHKLNQESHASTGTSKVFKFIPTCCTTFTPSNIMYGSEMSSRLDAITTRLVDVIEMNYQLGLNVILNVERPNRTKRQWEGTALVDESRIMGREGDKEALLGKLLGNEEGDQNVSIVSIVGLGGMGKTTLAALLYNHQKVKDHFPHMAWVSVPSDFDLADIFRTIFNSVATEQKPHISDLNLLHEALKEKLMTKRFLVVLDDVLEVVHSKWERLQNALVGAPGSKIMVTTRSSKVASMMGSHEIYNLDVLSNEDALSLFAQWALGERNFDKHPDLKLYAEGILKKCGGLPLALTTLGRVLSRYKIPYEWEKVLNDEIRDIHDGTGDGSAIIATLRQSYNDLSPELKRVFAYCSLFAKDYVFDKNKLVLLWMAEGFLSKSESKMTMESLGHSYFDELKSRSLFQHSTNDESGYTMHNLIHDLATSVAGKFFLRLDDKTDVSNQKETYAKLRHVSLIGSQWQSYRKLTEVRKTTCLRTFFPLSVGWESEELADDVVESLTQLRFLRVLSVTDLNPPASRKANQKITKVPKSIGSLKHLRYLNFSNTAITCLPEEVTKLYNLQSLLVSGCTQLSGLPMGIGSLKHLRYLNFSNTAITCLPEEVTKLYNLQSLLVSGCTQLSGLPMGIGKLINLRHLDISDTPQLEKISLGIGGLTSLQTLPKVIIAGEDGFHISELKGLSDLQGQLSIMGLDKVMDPIQAKDANLHKKKGLEILEMEWSDVFDDHSRNERIEYEVLEELKPHPNLRDLKILFYKGTTFPSWVGDPSFHQLTKLTLSGCKNALFPTLQRLVSLKTLFLKEMNEVKTVDSELPPSLEVLKFHDMKGWERWSTSGGDDNGTATLFGCLREISITCCPKLAKVSIGLLPSLKVLHIRESSEMALRSMVGVSSSLVELHMWKVEGLTQLDEEYLTHLRAVEDLCIGSCQDLAYLWKCESEASKILVNLRKLEVSYCKNLASMGEEYVSLGISMESLKEVNIFCCETLRSYNCPNSVERLEISFCDSITALTFSTPQEQPLSPTKSKTPLCLRSLEIRGCQNLESFPHEHFQSLASLEKMVIKNCPRMDYSFPCGLWPPNLKKLKIGALQKPMSEWRHQKFPTSLVSLVLYGENSGVVSFAVAEGERNTTASASASSSFLLPRSLTFLKLHDFEDVESLSEVLKYLSCLKRLRIYKCPKLSNVCETTFIPPNLTVVVNPWPRRWGFYDIF